MTNAAKVNRSWTENISSATSERWFREGLSRNKLLKLTPEGGDGAAMRRGQEEHPGRGKGLWKRETRERQEGLALEGGGEEGFGVALVYSGHGVCSRRKQALEIKSGVLFLFIH